MKLLLTTLLAASALLLPRLSHAEGAANWAYAAMPLNNEVLHIGSIYFVSSHFTPEAVDPTTCKKYTDDKIAAIVNGYADGAEGYLSNVPDGAVIGINVYGTDIVLWFDAKAAAAILSHTDPLALDPEAGVMTTGEGETVATAMTK